MRWERFLFCSTPSRIGKQNHISFVLAPSRSGRYHLALSISLSSGQPALPPPWLSDSNPDDVERAPLIHRLHRPPPQLSRTLGSLTANTAVDGFATLMLAGRQWLARHGGGRAFRSSLVLFPLPLLAPSPTLLWLEEEGCSRFNQYTNGTV